MYYRDVKTSKDTSITNARGRGRGRGGKADRGRDTTPKNKQPRNAIVSSSGLFSEGAAEGKQFFRSFRGSDESATASTLRRPTISSKREKFDPQLELKQIAEIYDLECDDIDGSNAASNTSEQFAPIILNQSKIQFIRIIYFNCFCCFDSNFNKYQINFSKTICRSKIGRANKRHGD